MWQIWIYLNGKLIDRVKLCGYNSNSAVLIASGVLLYQHLAAVASCEQEEGR